MAPLSPYDLRTAAGRGPERFPAGHRWDSSPKIRFAQDSPLEEARFEPSVPRRIDDAFETALFASPALPVPPEKPTRFCERDRRFESPSLRRRVCLTGDSGYANADRPRGTSILQARGSRRGHRACEAEDAVRGRGLG